MKRGFKFNVGDRVKCNCGKCDLVGTITGKSTKSKTLYRIKWDKYGDDSMFLNSLELIKKKSYNHPVTNVFK